MMVDDFGGYPSYSDPRDKEISDLKRKVNNLTAENQDMARQLDEYNQAPLRRMWTSFKDFMAEWFGVLIIFLIVGSGVGAAFYGNNLREKKEYASCAFAAKIQETKFEFDTYNEKCYLYDKKFEKFIPYATKAP